MATELQQHAEGGNRNEIQASQGGLVPKELGFNVNPAELEAIYRKLSGNEYLHFPSLERLGQKGDEGEDLAPDTQPGAKLIGVNGDNLTKIGAGHDDLQTVLERIDDAITLADQEYQFDNRDGTLASDIKTPRRFFSQFTEEEAAVGEGGHEIVGYDVKDDREYVKPIGVQANWKDPVPVGWTFDSVNNQVTYLADPVGTTIIQEFETPLPPGNRWFELTYELETSGTPAEGDTPPRLTTFTGGNDIDMEFGGVKTIYIKSTSTDPVEIGLTGGDLGFTLKSLGLKEVIGGNIDVHGKITGGGDKGIRVDGKGDVGVEGALSARPNSNSEQILRVPGVIHSFVDTSSTSNSGPGTVSCTIQANTLSNHGDCLEISASGSEPGTNDVQIRLGSIPLITMPGEAEGTGDWSLEAKIFRANINPNRPATNSYIHIITDRLGSNREVYTHWELTDNINFSTLFGQITTLDFQIGLGTQGRIKNFVVKFLPAAISSPSSP